MCDRINNQPLRGTREAANPEQDLQASSAKLHETTAVYRDRRRIMEGVYRRAGGCASTKFTIKDIEKIVSGK